MGKTPEQKLWHNLWFMHRMRPEDWEAMWTAQAGRCYLCDGCLPTERAQVNLDHDHACCPPRRSCRWCRRGMTCGPCNRIIGAARDNPEVLRHIAASLEAALVLSKLSLAAKPASPESLPARTRRGAKGQFVAWGVEINRSTVISVLGSDSEEG
jgi:hypothetical protein